MGRGGAVKVKTTFNPLQITKFKFLQIKKIADDFFKFDENGKKFSNWVENTV